MSVYKVRILFAGAIVFFIPLTMAPASHFKLGIENFSCYTLASEKTHSVSAALVTNHTAKDHNGVRTVDILKHHPCIKLLYILTPEHGISGTVPAAHAVDDSFDAASGLPIVSLYKNGSGARIPESCLSDIQTIFFDIQDCGMRHYTYVSTLYQVMQLAAKHHKQVVVLDRPNPLGRIMQGPLVEDSLTSFISIAPIPLRHGLTVGELAQFFNAVYFNKKVLLQVVPMKGYTGNQLPTYHSFSPNIPTLQSCYGYSFLGLMGEVRPIDVGLGSRYPFRCIALPDTYKLSARSWWKLSERLKKYGIKTIAHSYTTSRKKAVCNGLLITISSVEKMSSFPALLCIVQFFKEEGISLEFTAQFDKAIGTTMVREYVQGLISFKELQDYLNNKLLLFKEQVKPYILYNPIPDALLL